VQENERKPGFGFGVRESCSRFRGAGAYYINDRIKQVYTASLVTPQKRRQDRRTPNSLARSQPAELRKDLMRLESSRISMWAGQSDQLWCQQTITSHPAFA